MFRDERDEQTLRSITCLETNKLCITCLERTNFEGITCLETTNFEEYNMFREEQTLRSITCLENNKL